MDLLTGFSTVISVIALGAVLAHVGLVDVHAQRSLAMLSFFVAGPALMLQTISGLEVGVELGANLFASACSLLTAALVYATVARLVWRIDLGSVLIGALSSSYVNAGNLGLAIGAYVVGDAAVVVPTLLVQVLLVQPACLAALDRRAGRRGGGGTNPWRGLVANPITLASAGGLALAATGAQLPRVVEAPVQMLAGFAIPAMLLSYGSALRLSPAVGRSGHTREVTLAVVLKLGFQPLVAWAVGTAAGLDGPVLLGVVMTAALPTAQNIFLHATRYRVGEGVARETILLTTLGCLPVILLVALLLG